MLDEDVPRLRQALDLAGLIRVRAEASAVADASVGRERSKAVSA